MNDRTLLIDALKLVSGIAARLADELDRQSNKLNGPGGGPPEDWSGLQSFEMAKMGDCFVGNRSG
jgi:hypothetical protein